MRAPERRLEVDLAALDGDDGGAVRGERGVADDRLGQVHHVVVVAERLVGLEQRELGVVARVEALVAEHAADLEDAVHAADEQPLERQLQRDPQVHLDVERVVVRDERLAPPRRRPGSAAPASRPRGSRARSGRRGRPRSTVERRRRRAACPRVDDQVEVAAAVARLRRRSGRGACRAARAAPWRAAGSGARSDRQLAGRRWRSRRPRRRSSRRGRGCETSCSSASPTPSRVASSWIVPVSSSRSAKSSPPWRRSAHHAAGDAHRSCRSRRRAPGAT